jgi:predicted DNA-binding WGR domain protein
LIFCLKANARLKLLFNSANSKPTSQLGPALTPLTINKPAKKQTTNDDEDNMSDELSEEEIADDVPANSDEIEMANEANSKSQQDQFFTTFKLKSNIILNKLDNKSRTIFHHLACSLKYGSYSNLDICKLLVQAYQFVFTEKPNIFKMVPLHDYLGRVDSDIKKASDYALKHGNVELCEELKRLQKQTDGLNLSAGLNRFTVSDPFDAIIRRHVPQLDFQADSEKFLQAFAQNNTPKDTAAELRNNFKVDPMSNMNKTGCLAWADEKAGIPFDVVLTKTDVSYGMYGMHNFYKMQLISQLFDSNTPNSTNNENADGKVHVLFTRWGRIGDSGQCQRTPFATLNEAKLEFFKIFKQKTGNDFVETVVEKSRPFENKPRRYNLVSLESRSKLKLKDIDFSLFSVNKSSDKRELAKNQLALYQKSEFPPGLYSFWSDLLNVEHLKKTIRDNTALSVSYLPLTQLSSQSIERAYHVLNKKLKPLIERRMDLEKLSKKEHLMEYMQLLDAINKHSNEFYELIPQMNYNYEKLKPISNEKELNTQLCLLNQLTNAHVACRILMGAKNSSLNSFEYVYRALECKFELVEPSSFEGQYILKYASPSQSDIKFRVQQVFKIERANEPARFDQFTYASSGGPIIKNRRLLWHGTCTENLVSIARKGLCRSPVEASRSNGQRYGEGIYFSDAIEFSLNYARGIAVEPAGRGTSGSGPSWRVYMLVCEVGLGRVKELRTSFETSDSLPAGFDSVKAFGRMGPDPASDIYMPNGSVIPLGDMIDTPYAPGEYYNSRNCNHNQYVVYNEAQVCLRYIVQCEIDRN